MKKGSNPPPPKGTIKPATPPNPPSSGRDFTLKVEIDGKWEDVVGIKSMVIK